MAGLTGFSYYKEITISTANVDADLTNFPVYVPIVDDTDIGGAGKCRADGYDIQFSNSDNTTALSFQRLTGFAVAGGEANGDFFVLVPAVAGAADTIIRCYYGKADATDASDPSTVFHVDNGWKAVWHLEESGLPMQDSSSNDFDLDAASTAPTYQQAGLPGTYSISVAAATNRLTATGHAEAMIVPEGGMVSFWFKSAATPSAAYHYFHISTDGAFELTYGSSDVCVSRIGTSGAVNNYNTGYNLYDNAWHHISWSWVKASTLILYIDGVETDPGTTESATWPSFTGEDFYIGGAYGNIGYYDEFRVHGTVRSAAWRKFEALNMNDGHASGNELTWGAEVGQAADYVKMRWTK